MTAVAAPAPMTAEEVTAAYLAHRTRLIGLARHRGFDQTTAEDAVQDVFLAILTRASLTIDPAALPRYLSVATLNRARSVLQHRAVAERHPPAPPEPAPSAECTALERLGADAVAGRLAALSRMQGRVMALRLDGLRVDETAALLGITSGSVKSHASRARHSLAKELAP